MAETPQETSKKIQEAVTDYAPVAELVHDMAGSIEVEFAKSHEGAEAKQLKAIMDHITGFENFMRFISGKKGERDIDAQLNYLRGLNVEHDERLLKKMEEISGRIESHILSDWDKLDHYHDLRETIKEKLKLKRNVHEFVRDFNDLLVRTERYPETPIAKAIKSRKQIPYIIALENYEILIGVWKILMKRLYRPFDSRQNMLKGVIGQFDEKKIIDAIARKIKEDPDKLLEQVNSYFPGHVEDENFGNIKEFVNHLDIKENKLLEILYKNGQKAEVIRFIGVFGTAKARAMPPTIALDINDKFISPLESDAKKKEFETAAVRNFAKLLISTIESMEKPLKEEYKTLMHMIAHRIKELREKYAKSLAKLEEMENAVKADSRETLYAAGSAENYSKEIVALDRRRVQLLERASEITAIIETKTLLEDFRHGTLTEPECDYQITKLRARIGPEFERYILTMQDIYKKLMHNEKSPEEFERISKEIEAKLIMPLGTQMSVDIPEGLEQTGRKKIGIAAKLQDMLNVIKFHVDTMKRKSTGYIRKIKRLGVDVRSMALPSKDIEILERA